MLFTMFKMTSQYIFCNLHENIATAQQCLLFGFFNTEKCIAWSTDV